MYATITLYGAPFQVLPLTIQGPTADPQPRCHLRDIGLGCSRFARHYYGNLGFDFFSPATEMFQFAEYTSRCRETQGLGPFRPRGFPIRKSSAGSACLAADRSLSQLATSFVGIESRGIRVMR